MNVLILGATGMVGTGALCESLLSTSVAAITTVARSEITTRQKAPKWNEAIGKDILNEINMLGSQALEAFDSCFFCLGVSAAGLSEAQYRDVTSRLTLQIAQTLCQANPAMSFVYVSGAGADSTEKSSSMWARVRGETENNLLRMPFKRIAILRPAIIQPLAGARSNVGWYNVAYTGLSPVLSLLVKYAPGIATTTSKIGKAMINLSLEEVPSKILSTRQINEIASKRT